MSFNRTSKSKVKIIWICIGIQFQLSSAMIYFGSQSDIRVKTFAGRNSPESSLLNSKCLTRFLVLFGDPEERLWPFVFAMGFNLKQRASQCIININLTSVSKVMVVWICMGIPYQLSSAMIYYGPQSDIWVSSYGRPNVRGHSISSFERHDIYRPLSDIRDKTFACPNLPESSLFISGCLNRFPTLC